MLYIYIRVRIVRYAPGASFPLVSVFAAAAAPTPFGRARSSKTLPSLSTAFPAPPLLTELSAVSPPTVNTTLRKWRVGLRLGLKSYSQSDKIKNNCMMMRWIESAPLYDVPQFVSILQHTVQLIILITILLVIY